MEQKGVVVPKVQTAGSCFGLIGPRQCSAALGGPATSGLKKARELHGFGKDSSINNPSETRIWPEQ